MAMDTLIAEDRRERHVIATRAMLAKQPGSQKESSNP
jgi:hypothetical protein